MKVLFCLFVLALFGCKPGTQVSLTNSSGVAFDSVVVHVVGNSYDVGDMPSGATERLVVRPRSDSDIRVEMGTRGGRRRRLVVPSSYIEPHTGGRIVIELTGDSTIESSREY